MTNKIINLYANLFKMVLSDAKELSLDLLKEKENSENQSSEKVIENKDNKNKEK